MEFGMLNTVFIQNHPQENLIALPSETIARFGRGGVSATATSPDGNLIAVASRIGVWLYEAHTDNFLRLIAVEGTGLLSVVTFSHDGTKLATGDWDGMTTVWDVATGTELVTFDKMDYVSSVVFSPNGKFLAAGTRNGKGVLWDIDTGKARWTISHEDYISSVVFSPDGLLLATASWDSTANIWDVETGERRWCFSHQEKKVKIRFESRDDIPFNNEGINCIAFSQNGKFFATGDRTVSNKNGYTTLWDVQTGEAIWGFSHKKSATSITFSLDSRYMTTRFLEGGPDVRCIADGTSTSLEEGKWADRDTRDLPLTHPRSWYSWLVSFSPDGKHLVGMSELSAVKVWDIESGTDIETIDRDVGQAKSLTFSTEGNYIGLSRSGNAAILLIDDEQKAVFDHQAKVVSAAISPSGMLAATGGLDREINLWNITTQEHLRTFTGHIGAVYDVAFSPDEVLLASGGGRNFEMQEEDGILYFISPEGIPIDQTARVWEVETGKEIATLEHPDLVKVVTFSSDSNYLATTSENTIYLWDTKTWENKATLETVRVESFVFSPNSTLLAVGGSGKNAKIQIWQVETAQLVVEFSGHKSDVESVAFSPDGTLLASGGFDGVIYLWDMMPYLTKT